MDAGTTPRAAGGRRPGAAAPSPVRFVTLDAMRGVAALFVMFRHYTDQFAVRGEARFSFLAVDLFFVLSGFVLGFRHDKPDDGLTFGQYALRRVIRLFPLYLAGVALAALPVYYLAKFGPLGWSLGLGSLGLAGLMLPQPAWPGWYVAFPVLVPAWSLFFELWVANLLLGLLRGRLSDRLLLAWVAGAGLAYLAAAIHWGSFDLGPNRVGFAGGFPRVLFSFGLGLLLQRLHARGRLTWHLPSWLLLVALAAMLGQHFGGRLVFLYEGGCIFLLIPLLVAVGANARPRAPWLGTLLGDASYAVYVLHVPLLILFHNLQGHGYLPAGPRADAVLPAVTLVGAYLATRFYDEPVRRWLGAQLRRGRARRAMVPV